MWPCWDHKLNYRAIATALVPKDMKRKLKHIVLSYSENAIGQVKEPRTPVIAWLCKQLAVWSWPNHLIWPQFPYT